MEGQNFVQLVGLMKFPSLRETVNGNHLFQGKVAVPYTYKDRQTGEVRESSNYIKISAWGEVAQDLARLPEDTPVKVQGRVNERSYDSNCKGCGEPEKKYWTDVLVENFVPVGA
jgi:single-strand DNA-binding protein